MLSTDDNQFKIDSVTVNTIDGGRFQAEFPDEWFTYEYPPNDRYGSAYYEDYRTRKTNERFEQIQSSLRYLKALVKSRCH